MGTADRLKEYLEYKNIKVSNAETECGIGQTSLSKALPNEKGKVGKSIGSDHLEKILSTYTDLSADWLLRGKGSMLVSGDKEVELHNKIAVMSQGRKNQDDAYDIILSMLDFVGKTYDFYKEK